MLDAHSDLILGKQFDQKDWIDKFSDMSKYVLLWASDEILTEYGTFLQKRYEKYKIKEHEIHFAKMILAFRKEIGYKNKKNKLSPEQIILIFRSGYNVSI